MKTPILLLGVAALVAVPVSAQQRQARGLAVDRDVAIRLWVPAGLVEVQGWDLDSIDIRVTPEPGTTLGGGGSRAATKFSLETTRGDSVLASANMRVRVPRGARLWIKSTTASVHVQELQGELDVLQVGGPTVVSDFRGVVSVESIVGRIDLRRVVGTLRVRGGSGDMVATGVAGTIDVTMVSGAVTLVNGQAVGTNVPTSTDPMLRGRIETVGGAVSVFGSPGLGSVLDLATHDGAVGMMFTGPKPPFVEANTATGSIDPRLLSGQRSVATFRIRTFKGTVNASYGGGI